LVELATLARLQGQESVKVKLQFQVSYSSFVEAVIVAKLQGQEPAKVDPWFQD
jgi:hypothetical protein